MKTQKILMTLLIFTLNCSVTALAGTARKGTLDNIEPATSGSSALARMLQEPGGTGEHGGDPEVYNKLKEEEAFEQTVQYHSQEYRAESLNRLAANLAADLPKVQWDPVSELKTKTIMEKAQAAGLLRWLAQGPFKNADQCPQRNPGSGSLWMYNDKSDPWNTYVCVNARAAYIEVHNMTNWRQGSARTLISFLPAYAFAVSLGHQGSAEEFVAYLSYKLYSR